jgi:hypothetical protein
MDAVLDWFNRPVGIYRGFTLVRLDPLLVVAGVVCVAVYGYAGGVMGAIQGAAVFSLMVFCSLFMWR